MGRGIQSIMYEFCILFFCTTIHFCGSYIFFAYRRLIFSINHAFASLWYISLCVGLSLPSMPLLPFLLYRNYCPCSMIHPLIMTANMFPITAITFREWCFWLWWFGFEEPEVFDDAAPIQFPSHGSIAFCCSRSLLFSCSFAHCCPSICAMRHWASHFAEIAVHPFYHQATGHLMVILACWTTNIPDLQFKRRIECLLVGVNSCVEVPMPSLSYLLSYRCHQWISLVMADKTPDLWFVGGRSRKWVS